MHAKPELRVFLKWMIIRSGSVIIDVMHETKGLLMKTTLTIAVPIFVCILVISVGIRSAETEPEHKVADKKPVEESISTHMAYLFAPSYRRLKPLMRSEPTDTSGWKTIRSEALLLAESGGNLNSRRSSNGFNPDAQQNWPKNSAAVKKHGAELYRAAKDKDFKAVKRSYIAMTDSCNACHKSEVSIGSPPILTPFSKGIADK